MKTKPSPSPAKKSIPDTRHEEIKTEPPISEKDEVKQAEVRTTKAGKKHM